jgi:hypothetical protein
MHPKPTWEPLTLCCGACKHEWDDWQPLHVPAETWIAHVNTLRCPECAKRKLFMRASPTATDVTNL